MVKKLLPRWAIKSSEIKGWAKREDFDLFGGCLVQVCIRDGKDPVGVTFLRPFVLQKDGLAIVACLVITDSKGENVYYFAPWYRCIRSFVIDLQPEHFAVVSSHPTIQYIDGEPRERLRAILDEKERKEPWVKQNTSSQSSLEGWRSIFSPRKTVATKAAEVAGEAPRSWLPPQLAQAKP